MASLESGGFLPCRPFAWRDAWRPGWRAWRPPRGCAWRAAPRCFAVRKRGSPSGTGASSRLRGGPLRRQLARLVARPEPAVRAAHQRVPLGARAEHLQRHRRRARDPGQVQAARPPGAGQRGLVQPDEPVRGEKRDAASVPFVGRGHQPAASLAELGVRLLQNAQLELLGREHGAPAFGQRHALQEQHARGATGTGEPTAVGTLRRKKRRRHTERRPKKRLA